MVRFEVDFDNSKDSCEGSGRNTSGPKDLVHCAEENTLFFMLGPRGGPRSLYFDVTNVF